MHEPAQRHYASWILRELGYTVIEAIDGQEAVCLFHSNPNRQIDLLLADATMPRLAGKTLPHKLAAHLPPSRMLLCSHHPSELAVHNDLLDTELNYVQKPFTRTTLARKVREVLDNAQQEEQLLFTSVKDSGSLAVA
jgi:DNA-binding response OmpR family regulator